MRVWGWTGVRADEDAETRPPPIFLFGRTTRPRALATLNTPAYSIHPNPSFQTHDSKKIRFGLMSPGEIVRTSEMQVYERQLYNVSDHGVFDAGRGRWAGLRGLERRGTPGRPLPSRI